MSYKSYLTILFAVTLASATAFGNPHDTVSATIKKVTVYPDRARITRIATVDLPRGDRTIVIDSLPVRLFEESIRSFIAEGDGVKILGLNHKIVPIETSPQQRVALLQHQIDSITANVKQPLQDRLDAYTSQKNLLNTISKSAGDKMNDQTLKGGMEVSQWESAFRFVGLRSVEVGDSIRLTTLKIEAVDRQLNSLRERLALISSETRKAVRSIEIDLRSESPSRIELAVTYVIEGASWTPIYDARLVSESDSIDLNYNAEIRQTTGEDWNLVELTLSTNSPQFSAGPRDFDPWAITVRAKRDVISKFEVSGQVASQPVQKVDDILKSVAGVKTSSTGDVFIRGGRAGEAAYILNGAPVNDPLAGGQFGSNLALVSGVVATSFHTSFVVRRLETVPSGEKVIRTTIAQYRLGQKSELFCRPKLLDGVYRRVTVTNQNEAPLMPGGFTLFADADFVGNTKLNALVVPEQTFELPFGIDNSVKVERRILHYKRSESSSKTKIEQTVSIKFWNYAKSLRTISLDEPLPQSQDSRVKITQLDITPKPATVTEYGKASWTVIVQPSDSAVVSIPYRIEFPTGVTVSGL